MNIGRMGKPTERHLRILIVPPSNNDRRTQQDQSPDQSGSDLDDVFIRAAQFR
jgi:hypothetical protein